MYSLSKNQQMQEIEAAQAFLQSSNLSFSEAFAISFGDPRPYNDITFECIETLGFKGALLAKGDGAYVFHTQHTHHKHDNLVVGTRFLPGKTHLYSPI